MGLDVGQKNQIFYFGRDRRWNEIIYFDDVVVRQISDNTVLFSTENKNKGNLFHDAILSSKVTAYLNY